jgi:uncharacterized protein (TIGR03437 family)
MHGSKISKSVAVLFSAVFSDVGRAQVPTPATILEIDVENIVQYHEDVFDLSKFANNPGITPSVVASNFDYFLIIGDIVAVNGAPAKGTFANTTRAIKLNPAPTAGQAIADVVRATVNNQIFEILKADGTPIGTITTFGLGGAGSPPPGAPLQVTQGNNAIIGGTGAFLGARGQSGQSATAQAVPQRAASMTEDPANRRINGGGRARFVQHVIPTSVPQVLTTATGPAVFHADFSPVTAAKPAKAGEVLIVRASGLGPTRPGVNPGQPFPMDTRQDVNSPVDVTVNGQSAAVVNKLGWPGLVDTYRVDFRVPDGTAAGTASIQLTAAWITGPAVNIAVQ